LLTAAYKLKNPGWLEEQKDEQDRSDFQVSGQKPAPGQRAKNIIRKYAEIIFDTINSSRLV
jgi:hypothetical protein